VRPRRPIQTRFRSGCGCVCLSRPHPLTRWLILQKARHHRASSTFGLIVGIRFQSLFSLPSPGSFHLSLTVLVRYRSSSVFSLGGWTPHLPAGLACPAVLLCKQLARPFVYGAFHPLWGPFQNLRLSFTSQTLRAAPLFSPLLAEYFLLLRLLKSFSSPGSLASGYVFTRPYVACPTWFPIRNISVQNGCTTYGRVNT